VSAYAFLCANVLVKSYCAVSASERDVCSENRKPFETRRSYVYASLTSSQHGAMLMRYR
jgi:hypothetical protein